LGKFSLKIPFWQFRICQDLRGNTGYSYQRCSSWKRPSFLGLVCRKT